MRILKSKNITFALNNDFKNEIANVKTDLDKFSLNLYFHWQ
jgi:hypothetical protein